VGNGRSLRRPADLCRHFIIEGQFLAAAFMDRQLELNSFAVSWRLLSAPWLLGPIGAFLAVPLLMALTVTIGHALAEEKPDLPE